MKLMRKKKRKKKFQSFIFHQLRVTGKNKKKIGNRRFLQKIKRIKWREMGSNAGKPGSLWTQPVLVLT